MFSPWEMSHHLEDIRSFIEINRCKEDLVCESGGVTPGVSQDLKLFIGLSEMETSIQIVTQRFSVVRRQLSELLRSLTCTLHTVSVAAVP